MLYCFLLLSYRLDSLSFLLYQACEYEFPLFCSPSLPVGQFYNYLRNGMMYATPDEKYKLVSLCFWMERKEKKLHNWNKKIKKTFYQNSTYASDDIQSCFVPKKRDKHLPNRYLSVNEKKVFFSSPCALVEIVWL